MSYPRSPAGPRSDETPTHVGIIMDGNGRWAKARGLPRFEGHRRGVEALRRTVRSAIDHDVRFLTIYSFSTENWRRPPDEVAMLMGLLKRFVRNDLAELHAGGVRVRIIGERGGLASDIRVLLDEAEALTRANVGLTLIVAFNYGSRQEIVAAARRLAVEACQGLIDPDAICEEDFAARLDTADIPDPDLIIRTSGEMRLSNFLLWQTAYAELVFMPILWPDFDDAAFVAALEHYGARERRFGAVVEFARGHVCFVSPAGMSANPDDAGAPPTPGRGVFRIGPDLWPRVAAAVVMGLVALGVAWTGGIVFVAFWWIAAAIVMWEWQRIVGGERLLERVFLGALCLAGAALCALHNWAVPAVAMLVVAGAAVGFVAAPDRRIWAGMGALYGGALVVGLGLLEASPIYGLAAVLWLFAIVWGADVAAFFAGRAIGGPRLWPSVSPGKTWSGAIAGALAGAALGLVVGVIFAPGPVRIDRLFALGLATAVMSEFGDLFESAVKRRFGVKDSSRLIPGHGGLMDRLDSFIAASTFAAIVAAAHSSGPYIASGLFEW